MTTSRSPTTVLWGERSFVRRTNGIYSKNKSGYHSIQETSTSPARGGTMDDTWDESHTNDSVEVDGLQSPKDRQAQRPVPGSLRDFFFGFMYEEDFIDDDDDDTLYICDEDDNSTDRGDFQNTRLYCALGISLALSSMAAATAVTLVSVMGHDVSLQQQSYSSSSVVTTAATDDSTLEIAAQQFAQDAAAAAVLGMAVGKLCHGMVPDVLGARRTSVLYAWGLCATLLCMGMSPSATSAQLAAFGVEFVAAVQWPCTIVILATHYRGQPHLYQRGVGITSLASRCGSLLGIPLSAGLMQSGVHWRWIAVAAAWCCAISASVTYWFVTDSAHARNEPQNPIDPLLWTHAAKGDSPGLSLQRSAVDHNSGLSNDSRYKSNIVCQTLRWMELVLRANVWPSMSHILGSGTFWIVALAHTGATMVRTSQRLLGTYLYATRSTSSDGTFTYERAASLVVWYSFGSVLGLAVAGPIFSVTRDPSARKWMIARLYILTIAACYVLAFLAIPSIRRWLDAPDLVTFIQVSVAAAAGFGIAVPSYHIPSLVGVTFGCDKGLFAAYIDGVACALSFVSWRHVQFAMWQERDEIDSGVWAYAWAAIALFLIVSAWFMVEFMGHFFRKSNAESTRRSRAYETVVFS